MTIEGLGGKALDLAVIGNCRTAALTDTQRPHRLVVLPALRFRSGLLAPAGRQRGEGLLRRASWRARSPARSAYLRNTAIVQTTIRDGAGNAVRITDFTPRFKRFERVFNPPQIFRRIEPLAGLPRIKIRVRPTFNYGGSPAPSRAIGLQPHPLRRRRRRAAR